MILITFYTKDTPYEEEVKGLAESVKAFDYTLMNYGITNTGDWTANCAMKPKIILRAMNEFPEEKLFVYLDADAVIKRKIQIPDGDWKIGVRYRTGDYRDWETDRKSTRLNSSHSAKSRMPSSA